MNVTKLFFEVPLPVWASEIHDNVEVRLYRERPGVLTVQCFGASASFEVGCQNSAELLAEDVLGWIARAIKQPYGELFGDEQELAFAALALQVA